MSESLLNESAESFEPADRVEPLDPGTTGDDAVDAVVASLRGLDDLPVAEHVGVFERAHESLRQVLSGANQPVAAVQVSRD